MKTSIISEGSAIDLMCDRFAELNGLELETKYSKQNYLHEVCNLSYAIKMLIT